MAAVPQVVDQRTLQQRHQQSLSTLGQQAQALLKRQLTYTTAALAQELDTTAKQWLAAFEAEVKPTRTHLFAAHRAFTELCAKMSRPAERAREVARSIISRYELAERKRLEAERLERERIAREEAEAARQAEITARLAEAAQYEQTNPEMAEAIVQEAQDLEDAPVMPVHVPELESIQKIEGVSTRFELVGEVTDKVAYLKWLIERPDCIDESIEFRVSGIKAQLKRGLSLPGVTVTQRAIVSNRSR